MRVLVVSNMFPPHALGGYERMCADAVTRWCRAGHQVEVLVSDFVRADRRDVPDEPWVRRSLRMYWDDHRVVTPPVRERLRRERHNQAQLRAVLDSFRPSVISLWHMGGLSAGLVTAAVESGVPVVAVLCDDWLTYVDRMDAWARLFRGRKRTARLVRAVTGLPTALPDLGARLTACFISEHTRRTAERATGWRFGRSEVVHSGVDVVDFPLRAPLPRAWTGRLLCVGRVESRKGFTDAVRMLAQLPGHSLEICGPAEPEHLRELHALAARLGVAERVRFREVDRSALAPVYAAADALVFTSAWEEPFGVVPLEAMACATPVVAEPSGGAREYLVDGDNCLAVAPGDVDALAAAVCRLSDDEQLRSRLVHGGLRSASALTIDRFAERLEQVHAAASAAG